MTWKALLCKAFCDDIAVHEVPAGLAVSTAFSTADGDRIAFFVKSGSRGFRIEDDGLLLPTLEASGVDFRSGTRGEALEELKREYGVELDVDTQEFFVGEIAEKDVPSAALKFVAFSLRVRDFMLMTEYRVATTFREDAAKLLREAVGTRAQLTENESVTERLSDFPADFVLRAPGRPPVGVYLGMSDQRILEAIVVQLRNRHELHENCKIIALLEKGRSISARVRQQASNRLDVVTEFRGDEVAAVGRIAREALGPAGATLQ